MRHGSIYIATNKHTGDQYVGQTRQLVQKRWDAHWRTAICNKSRKAKFQIALKEFGKDAFLIVDFFSAFDAESLNEAEISLIKELKPSYNSSRGGKGLCPIFVSEELKQKRSEAAKIRWANEEWKLKTVESIRNACKTEEAKIRGKNVSSIGNAARWENHVKKPKVAAKIKQCKQKRDPSIGKALTAQSKWKPVYCPELQCSFLSQKAASEYFGVLHTSITEAIKRKGKVKRMFSLIRVT